MATSPTSMAPQLEKRLKVLKRTLMKHGAELPVKSRLLLAQEIRHQEWLLKVVRERHF
jgi:hypothetical protein